MNHGKYVFSQVMDSVPYYQFLKCVEEYKGHHWIKRFSCWEQFLAMSFGQLSYRESLRDVVVCLHAQRAKLYHLGFRSKIVRPTLARANEKRDWRIYRDFAQILIGKARQLYIDDKEFSLNLEGTCYVLDSTIIDLCFSVFPWAKFRKTKSAIKIHTLMDLHGSIPTFFHISDGKMSDVGFLDMIKFEVGAYYIMDRGYLDFNRLYNIYEEGSYFITRAKSNFSFERLYSKPVDKSLGLQCDQVIRLSGYQTSKKYPELLRRIKYTDNETGKRYVFLTNDFNIDSKTIADLYKYRWQIELFFKWIKQHLRIKTFWGQSENAVKTQICIAICIYLIVAILKKRLGIERNLYEMLQILNVSLFDKTPLFELFSEYDLNNSKDHPQNTLQLFDI
jgi:transposase